MKSPNPNPDLQYSPEELKQFVARMRQANAAFYGLAVATGVHTYIEFCGLQAKFIDLCADLAEAGIDFTMLNVHTGQRGKMPEHHLDYLAEKFECIYSPFLAGNPEAIRYFIARAFGEEYVRHAE